MRCHAIFALRRADADVAEPIERTGRVELRGDGTALGHIGDGLNTSHLFMTRRLPADAYSTCFVGSAQLQQ
jgi:hypothetical protein